MGLTPAEFWELTWYEWGLYLQRLSKINKEKVEEWEKFAYFFGDLMALTANIHRDAKKRPAAFTREDFYNLSSEKKKGKISLKLTPEEVEAKFNGKRHPG